METRANYVLIGVFALAGFFGILVFFLWFARIELDRQFSYYDIDFTSVSGLSDASDVRFAGLPVGQVVDVRLSPEKDGTVRVRIEIGADTPVRTDSVATIEAQGVTGVAFVGISAGTPEAPLLAGIGGSDVPMIPAGQSILQSLSQNAPELLSETLEAVRSLRDLMGDENQGKVRRILDNVEQSSAEFSQALEDFSQVSASVSEFAQDIDRFNATLDRLTTDFGSVMEAATATLTSIEALSEETRGVVAKGSETLAATDAAVAEAGRYIRDNLRPETERLGRSFTEIEARLMALADNADSLFATYAATGEAATARLSEARATLSATDDLIARLTTAADSVDSVARRLDGLAEAEAAPLLAELRVATAKATDVIKVIGDTAETDLAAIMADIRAATETASSVIESVGRDLSAASGKVDGIAVSAQEALAGVRDTFARANDTLAAINGALETGDRALAAAESAFSGADQVIREDVAEITNRLRDTLTELEAAIGTVSAEIPVVTEEIRSASRSAEAAFAGIEGAVTSSAPAVRDFATTALPQYGRLAVETRALVENLEKLVEQIRRDPSRFFLSPRAPEYRR